MKYVTSITLGVLIAMPAFGSQKSAEVERAIDFLQTACVTSGSQLNISADAEGALSIKKIKSTGASASIKIEHKQIEGFADAASKLSASQATEMRECMKPYIERIISVYLQGTVEPEPKSVTIETQGGYFVLQEFDLVMTQFANHPKTIIGFRDAAQMIDLHPAKIELYLNLAIKNDFIYFYNSQDKDRSSGYVIDKNGISYVLSKGLVQ
ncbi:hypothetical protein DU972_003843 [Vibrio mimicus]